MHESSLNHFPQQEYTTSLLHGYSDTALNSAKLMEKYFSINNDSGLFISSENKFGNRVISLVNDLESVNSFLHPITYSGATYIDARAYVERKTGGLKNSPDYIFLRRRALIDLIWFNNREILSPLFPFVLDAFSTWVASGIQRSTGVNLLMATYFKIIAAIFYYSLLIDNSLVNKEDIINTILMRLPRMINIPAQTINDLIQ